MACCVYACGSCASVACSRAAAHQCTSQAGHLLCSCSSRRRASSAVVAELKKMKEPRHHPSAAHAVANLLFLSCF
ncbi:hypothetical protein GUJ93_ZPchr0001g31859 [Zizania palustris]|uniref:Uncharacterized protein n=1 Tax=Zizania palustris TaxID=103762 RepID=A0A8J5VNH1_ZIZPA|nr:hypothetical protein GUJ93_ZPchr0001g31859 [Zizania palustris]